MIFGIANDDTIIGLENAEHDAEIISEQIKSRLNPIPDFNLHLVSPAKLKELVLKGTASSYDSLKSKYNFDNMAFTKLKSTYRQRTGNQFEEADYESFGIIDEDGNLTNAGALLADESPIKHSRLSGTGSNGRDC